MPAQHALDKCRIQHVALFAQRLLAGDRAQALQHGAMAVGEVVQNHRHVPGLRQGDEGVTADVTGAAGQKDFHVSEWGP
jgi:hypothetical protein